MVVGKAGAEDIRALTALRIAYVREDHGGMTEDAEKRLASALPAYFSAHLNHDLFVYTARESAIVSCAFLLVREAPPSLGFPTGRIGTVYNVYTLPDYRRRGLARRVMRELLSDAQRLGTDFAELKATKAGVPLYEALGFRETDSGYLPMRKYFPVGRRAEEREDAVRGGKGAADHCASPSKIAVVPFSPEAAREAASLWNEIVAEGRAFPQTELLDEKTGQAFFEEQSFTGLAYAEDGALAGLYILHPNNVGRCGHLCNASYAVGRAFRGRGIGEALVRHSIEKGRALGFRVLQFNAVVAGNKPALALYQKLGFTRLGVIPGGFLSKNGEYEDIIPHYIAL